MNETTQKKPAIQVRTIVRIIALVCFALGFMPMCLVSCSGQSKEFGALDAVSGIKMNVYEGYDQQIVDPHPIMLLVFLIPLLILVFTWLKQLPERTRAGVSAGMLAADVVIWLRFKSAAKEIAEANFCEFKTTGWYGFNLVLLVAFFVLLLLVVLKILSMDASLAGFGAAGQVQSPPRQAAPFAERPVHVPAQRLSPPFGAGSGTVIGYCAQCGAALKAGARFCGACGSPIMDENAARQAAEEQARQEEAARQAAAEQAQREEAARQAAEEQARREEAARQAAAEQARREEAARQAAAEQAQREEAARQAAAEQARQEEAARQAADVETPQELMQEDSGLQDTETSAVPPVLYCSECGAKLTPDARFCLECGTPTDE